MILFDSRFLDTKPRNFLDRFGGLALRVDTMYAGDATFCNADGTRQVCVEVKLPLDLCECIEHTGRLVQQLKNARAAGADLYCLVAQGLFRTNEGEVGVIRRGGRVPLELAGSARRVQYRSVDNFLTTLSLVEGVLVKRAEDDAEMAEVIRDLYYWWQKDVEDHQSTRRFYTPMFMPERHHTLVRRVAKELPGVGIEKSRLIDRRFPSLRALVEAGEKEWREIDGIGKTMALRIVQEVNGEK